MPMRAEYIPNMYPQALILKKVLLGNTGIEVSIVGFGVLPIGPSQLALPVEEGAEIIKYAIKNIP